MMTNFSELSVCEKCGGPVELRHEGSTQGLFCTKCDWSVVTTRLPEILGDETSYEVTVSSGDYTNEQHMKTVATLTGLNYLAARKLMQSHADFVVFTGKASQVAAIRKKLELARLSYKIKPPFPW
jgi:hypothetical protein